MSQHQQSLFDNVTALPPAAPQLVELGRRVPPTVKFGTSTWTYDGWAGDLDDFLRQLPRDFRYAVELRNRELLTDTHGAVLAHHRVAHVFNSWTAMPTLGEQLELPWAFPAPFTIARALLRPGRRYADAVKLFEPYDRIRDPQPELRQDLLRLVAEAMRRRIEALILVNNRLEGNAPETIRALVAALTGEGP